MRTFLYILLATLLLASGACNRRDTRLTAASDIMYTAPDSALAFLRHIDPSDISGAGNRALYALLLSQAMSKCHIPPSTDSIADIAVAYYDRRGADSLRMLAHFYRAVALDAIGNKGEALTEALLTTELAKEQQATYWQARAHELLGDIYYSGYNMDASIRNDCIAYRLFETTGYHINAAYSLLSLSMAYEHKGDHQKSLDILDTLEMQYQYADSYLLGYIQYERIRPLNSLNRSHEAISRLQRALDYWNNDSSEILWSDIAVSYLALDSIERARICLEKPLPLNVPEYIGSSAHIKYKYYKQLNNPDSALKHLEISRQITNSNISKAFARQLTHKENMFLKAFYNQKQQQNARRQNNILIIAALFLFIAGISFIFYSRKQYIRKKEFTNKILELNEDLKTMSSLHDQALENLNDTKEVSDKTIQKLRNDIERLQSNETVSKHSYVFTHITIVNDLCNAYFECSASKNYQDKLGSLFEQELREMQSENFRQKLCDFIDSQNIHILSKLSNDLPRAKTEDIYLFALVISGFSPKAISIILDIQLSNYYNRLSRLKSKIEALAPDKSSLYLTILQNRKP